eukprot:jgi/Ulvmu1/7662/UM038_0091.1
MWSAPVSNLQQSQPAVPMLQPPRTCFACIAFHVSLKRGDTQRPPLTAVRTDMLKRIRLGFFGMQSAVNHPVITRDGMACMLRVSAPGAMQVGGRVDQGRAGSKRHLGSGG